MKCEKCYYEWKPRVAKPKKCPRCTTWLIPRPRDILRFSSDTGIEPQNQYWVEPVNGEEKKKK